MSLHCCSKCFMNVLSSCTNYCFIKNYINILIIPGVALPARPRRVKPNSGELKLYVISPDWRVELLLSFQFSIRYCVFCLCTAWHAHTVFSYVYGTTRIRCLTHKLQQCLQTRTNTQQRKELMNYNVRYHPLSTTP